MVPEDLRAALESRGLTLLGVGRHHADPSILLVYLDSASAQRTDCPAVEAIASVSGVISVTESVGSKTTVLVLVTPNE